MAIDNRFDPNKAFPSPLDSAIDPVIVREMTIDGKDYVFICRLSNFDFDTADWNEESLVRQQAWRILRIEKSPTAGSPGKFTYKYEYPNGSKAYRFRADEEMLLKYKYLFSI